jgi:UDP-glucose 4-epimerase
VNYLIFGGAGYLGSHLVQLLHANNHKVTVFDDSSGNVFNQIDGVDYIFGDISEPTHLDKLDSILNIDGIFHLAAKKSVKESVHNPDLYLKINFEGSKNIIDYSNRREISNLVFASSAAVYGEAAEEGFITENSIPNPVNPYGESKYLVENLLEKIARQQSLNSISLRIFNMVGAREPKLFDEKGENVIPVMLRHLAKREDFSIYGSDYDTIDGTCVRDYVNVNDVAKAHVLAMNYLQSNSVAKHQAVNVSSCEGISVLQLIQLINTYTPLTLRHKVCPRRLGDPGSVIGDNRLAFDLIGWRPSVQIRQSIEEVLHGASILK